MMLNRDTPKRRLAVDLSELEYAFEDASWEARQHLIVAPPLELWPQIVARVPVPQDVEQSLIAPLKVAQ